MCLLLRNGLALNMVEVHGIVGAAQQGRRMSVGPGQFVSGGFGTAFVVREVGGEGVQIH
jgi:hypothetical protein